MEFNLKNFNLSEKELKFLKELASKHYDGAKDNVSTCNALHVVESKRYEYIPWFDGSEDWYGDNDLVFTYDDEYEVWYEDEAEMVRDYLSDRLEDEIKLPILSYKDAEGLEMTSLDGEDIYVFNQEDYFKAYGVPVIATAWKKPYWKPMATFLIRDEAVRYQSYQSHNLGVSRIYTYSMGYANYGDMPVFRDMLIRLGQQLNKEENENA